MFCQTHDDFITTLMSLLVILAVDDVAMRYLDRCLLSDSSYEDSCQQKYLCIRTPSELGLRNLFYLLNLTQCDAGPKIIYVYLDKVIYDGTRTLPIPDSDSQHP
jgi:hypothetical protein